MSALLVKLMYILIKDLPKCTVKYFFHRYNKNQELYRVQVCTWLTVYIITLAHQILFDISRDSQ